MSIDINRATIVGRLTKKPELRVTKSGQNVCSFTVATGRSYKDANGDYPTDFIECVAWRKTAEYLASHGDKGLYVSVSGPIQTRNYEDKDGKRVYVTEIQADTVNVEYRKGQGNNTTTATTDPFAGNTGSDDTVEVKDSDLPF